jgi:dethiobiotin synthetase
MSSIFISGIDTGIGKTIATGLLAKFLLKQSERVITQKIVQTGCKNVSDDILVHRHLMGCGFLEQDKKGLTCPYLFRHPSSPHLSAGMEGKKINIKHIQQATIALEKEFTTVLIEGAGGLMVPLNSKTMVLDYILDNQYPVILVSSSRLGSINHTCLSIEALRSRNIKLLGIIYNLYAQDDALIANDSMKQIRIFMMQNHYPGNVVAMNKIDLLNLEDINFSSFFLDID